MLKERECVTPLFKIIIICTADERYKISKKTIINRQLDFFSIFLFYFSRYIERMNINGNLSVPYHFSYNVHRSQYAKSTDDAFQFKMIFT